VGWWRPAPRGKVSIIAVTAGCNRSADRHFRFNRGSMLGPIIGPAAFSVHVWRIPFRA
jgi:hypothetical protein